MDKFALLLNSQLDKEDFEGRQHDAKAVLSNYDKIIVYGAGSGFVSLSVNVLERYGFLVDILLDRRFVEEKLQDGTRMCHPENYKPTDEELKNSIVIVTIGDNEQRYAIINNLKARGFKNVISAMDIYEYHLQNPTHELNAGFSFYRDRKEEVLAAFSLFHERQSREVFFQFLQVHLTRSNLEVPSRPYAEQYVAPDIFTSADRSRYICCGAYDGDTVRQFYKIFGKFSGLVCFEPDDTNFANLVHSLNDDHKNISNELMLFPCGVFSCEKKLYFSSGRNACSMLSEQGDSLIQCVAIDHGRCVVG